jgi:hypothetical protein
MGPITRRKHEARNSEIERLHRQCAETAEREREKTRLLNDEITALLAAAQEEARPVWPR